MNKLLNVANQEVSAFQFRLLLLKIFTFFLPNHMGNRWRAAMLRMVGFRLGHGALIGGMPTFTGGKGFYKNLIIGKEGWLNFGCVLDLGDQITIGNHVDIGHEVLLITTTHEIGSELRRAATKITKPIIIQDGAWLGSRCTILPGVTVGKGAVVAAGAVVVKDVAPNTLVGGVPASVIRELPIIYAATKPSLNGDESNQILDTANPTSLKE